MNDNMQIGLASNEAISKWKQKYISGIYCVTSGQHIAYFKNPNRAEINCALSKTDINNTLAVYEELASLTFIGGSEMLLTDDSMFLGLCHELKDKLEGTQAQLVNL
jgi:hypothetical protein